MKKLLIVLLLCCGNAMLQSAAALLASSDLVNSGLYQKIQLVDPGLLDRPSIDAYPNLKLTPREVAIALEFPKIDNRYYYPIILGELSIVGQQVLDARELLKKNPKRLPLKNNLEKVLKYFKLMPKVKVRFPEGIKDSNAEFADLYSVGSSEQGEQFENSINSDSQAQNFLERINYKRQLQQQKYKNKDLELLKFIEDPDLGRVEAIDRLTGMRTWLGSYGNVYQLFPVDFDNLGQLTKQGKAALIQEMQAYANASSAEDQLNKPGMVISKNDEGFIWKDQFEDEYHFDKRYLDASGKDLISLARDYVQKRQQDREKSAVKYHEFVLAKDIERYGNVISVDSSGNRIWQDRFGAQYLLPSDYFDKLGNLKAAGKYALAGELYPKIMNVVEQRNTAVQLPDVDA